MEARRSPAGAAAGDLTEGERWTRDALDDLRAGRFSPRALIAFLEAAFRRARQVRGRRPELARQSRLWGATGFAGALPFGPRAAAWWAGWWAMADWHLGMLERADGSPRPLAAADALTLFRLWLAPVIRRHPRPALLLAAAATDVLDGPLARRAGPTRFGRDFDSAADTSLLHMLLAGLVEHARLPRRALAAEQARFLTGAAVGVAAYFGGSQRPATPEERAVAATLAFCGLMAAAAGDRAPGRARTRAAEALLAGAAGGRLLLGLRSLARPGR